MQFILKFSFRIDRYKIDTKKEQTMRHSALKGHTGKASAVLDTVLTKNNASHYCLSVCLLYLWVTLLPALPSPPQVFSRRFKANTSMSSPGSWEKNASLFFCSVQQRLQTVGSVHRHPSVGDGLLILGTALAQTQAHFILSHTHTHTPSCQ